MDGNDELPGLVGDLNILGVEVDGRGEFPEGVGDVLARLVGDVLPEYRQLFGMDAEEEPASVGV